MSRDPAFTRAGCRPAARSHVDFPRLEGYSDSSSAPSTSSARPADPVLPDHARDRDRDPRRRAWPDLIGSSASAGVATTFGMVKFRSMVAGADDQLASLLDLRARRQPLLQSDRRPSHHGGRALHPKHSIDELPQLFNVSREMSWSAPPPARGEVAPLRRRHASAAARQARHERLWQVSGRSNLSWEDFLRLDLYYVENWSFTAGHPDPVPHDPCGAGTGETAH